MGLTWTSWIVLPMLALVTAWSAAAILLRTAPDRSLNRRLALVLFLEGLWLGGGFLYVVDDRTVVVWLSVMALTALAAVPFQYLSFLGVALSTRLVRPFRSRIAFVVLALVSIGAGLWVILEPWTFMGELYSPEWATWNFQFRPPGARLVQIHGLASLFGLAVTLTAYFQAAPDSAARSRAKWFMIAFGVRDLFNAAAWLSYPVLRPVPFWGDWVANQGGALINIAYVALLAYAVLHVQLFDIDLKIKFALRQGTVGAVIAAGFFTGSELLEAVIPVEGTILGIVLAGGIVTLLRPLQRLAEGFANRVMPGVHATPAYVEGRKHEVYRATVEGTLEDGAITERERAILERLRRNLGISIEEAETLERQLLPT